MKYVIALEGSPGYPWMLGEQLLYMGEIENMRGHGVYMQNNTKIHHGYNTGSFFEYTDTHYGDGVHGYIMSDFFKVVHGVFCLPQNLVELLIELNKSHSPEAAEKSFVVQASKLQIQNFMVQKEV